MKDPVKVKRGKKSKAAGGRFELKVRKDLESNGWIVSKWMNNVEFKGDVESDEKQIPYKLKFKLQGKLIPSKHKFRGKGIPMTMGNGFPDFVAFELAHIKTLGKLDRTTEVTKCYEVIGVEAKSNGYLDKVEKVKCKWLLENNVFSKILIAKKGEKRGTIKYTKFKE